MTFDEEDDKNRHADRHDDDSCSNAGQGHGGRPDVNQATLSIKKKINCRTVLDLSCEGGWVGGWGVYVFAEFCFIQKHN